MEWITKLEFPKCKTNKEALYGAYQMIKNWCKDNEFDFKITHNTSVDLYHSRQNANRCVTISNSKYIYTYKLTISTGYEYEIVREEYQSLFRGKRFREVKREIPNSKYYYGWLERM